MRTLKLVIEYDGTCYHGWQRQPNGITIQEVLEKKIAVITQENIQVTGSGRTDAGVHACSQVAHFRTASAIPVSNLLQGINSLLPPDIAIKDIQDVGENFHARYSALSKEYCYRILNSSMRSALYRNSVWHIRAPLQLSAMEEAALCLRGSHDFTSFCAAKGDAASHVRTVLNVAFRTSSKERIINFFIEADGFLRYMVRNIVGTLVDVGLGKLTPQEFLEILEKKDRTKAGITAPPQGLFLKEVKYLPDAIASC